MPHIYKSSFKFTTLTTITKDDFRKARHIITHIIDNPESAQFREPVNWQALGLLDYPSLIPNPMDLGTVLRKTNDEEYQHVEEFLDDTELIWDNCKSYNLKGSWIYQLADKLQKNCKKMLKNYFPTIPLQNIKKQATTAATATAAATTTNVPVQAPITEIFQKDMKIVLPEAPKIIKTKKSQKVEKSEKNIKLYYEDEQEITFVQKMKLADKFKILSAHENGLIVDYIQVICPSAFREQDDRVQVLVDNMDVISFKQIIEKIEQIQTNGLGQSTKRQKVE